MNDVLFIKGRLFHSQQIMCGVFLDPLAIFQFWVCDYNMLYASILHASRERSALAKPPFQTHLLAFIKSVNSLIVNM